MASRECPIQTCSVLGSVDEITKHLIEHHEYVKCICERVMHRSTFHVHKKSCSKFSSSVSDGPCFTMPKWSMREAEIFIGSLNTAGNQRWSVKNSTSKNGSTVTCYWKCFFPTCSGKSAWCRSKGFRKWKCSNHLPLPATVQRIPQWLTDDTRRKASAGVGLIRLVSWTFINFVLGRHETDLQGLYGEYNIWKYPCRSIECQVIDSDSKRLQEYCSIG